MMVSTRLPGQEAAGEAEERSGHALIDVFDPLLARIKPPERRPIGGVEGGCEMAIPPLDGDPEG